MRTRLFAVLTLLIVTAPAFEAQRSASEPSQLPVRRVILYKSGVGFFEHLGPVTGASDVTIQFTTGQLNDVLKSLAAVDLDGGRVANISYNSIAPIDQRLGAVRLPLGSNPTPLDVYNALRGARVEVRTAAAGTTGRLLGVERRQRQRNGAEETVDELTLVTDEGSIRTFIIGPDVTVHLGERDMRDELSSYLSIVASGRDQDARRMVISATGSGTRRLLVSYISEVPIWKSTYRLVLPEKSSEKPLLQGWAIVDNTIGEDWSNVELSLVAGAPQSFIQNISQPYYVQRPVVPLPQSVLLQPQTHAPTQASGSMSDSVTRSAESPLMKDAPSGGVGGGNYRRGVAGGVVGGVVGGLPEAAPAPAMPVRSAIDRAASVVPDATAQELGDLYEYKLKQPVTIKKNQSALVPILNTEISAERVSLWTRGQRSGRPLRAVWLTNSSGLTLDGGTFSVVDANAFAGEGLIDPLKPGERRLVSYGADLGVLVTGNRREGSTRYTKIVAHEGILSATVEDRATWDYRIRNEDTTARTVVIEHPLERGWSVGAEPAPAESSPSAARYRVPVASKQDTTFTVTERRAGQTTYRIADVDERAILVLIQGGAREGDLRKALQPILTKRAELAAADARLAAIANEISTIGTDQQRVRENMKALRGSDEEKALVQRYTRELNAQEDRLDALQADQKKATAERDQRRAELSALAGQASFEIGG